MRRSRSDIRKLIIEEGPELEVASVIMIELLMDIRDAVERKR